MRVVSQGLLVAIDILPDAAVPGDGHRDVQVLFNQSFRIKVRLYDIWATDRKKTLDDMAASSLTLVGHAPDVEPADHDSVRAERDGLEYIRTCADARVEKDRHLCSALDCLVAGQ